MPLPIYCHSAAVSILHLSSLLHPGQTFISPLAIQRTRAVPCGIPSDQSPLAFLASSTFPICWSNSQDRQGCSTTSLCSHPQSWVPVLNEQINTGFAGLGTYPLHISSDRLLCWVPRAVPGLAHALVRALLYIPLERLCEGEPHPPLPAQVLSQRKP